MDFFLQVNVSSPILRDISLLLVSFLMILGTLYVYFRLRTSTFRRVRHLLEERVEVKTRQLSEKNLELEKLSLVADKTDNSVIIAGAGGKVEFVNDGFTRLTGINRNVIGKNIGACGDRRRHLARPEPRGSNRHDGFDRQTCDLDGPAVEFSGGGRNAAVERVAHLRA